ncbi:MAG: HlyD family efflux transporter periplasmic adaptor subunit [bacterium]|nr:HlyD family efflux transporter periplasmic adaptor subunit [bacterium]
MKLRSRQSYLNSIGDGAPKKRITPRIFKLFYFIAIIVIIAYIITYIIQNSFLYVYGTGVVEPEKFYVQSNASCEIIEYYVKEKQRVKKGDDLLKIVYDTPNTHINNTSNALINLPSITRELNVLKHELKKKKTELQESVLFKSLRKEKNEDNTILSKNREDYSEIKNEVDTIKYKIKLLEDEQGELKTGNNPAMPEITNIIKSKFNGTVFRIIKKKYEHINKGDNLLIIEEPSVIVVEATFNSEYTKYFNEGNEARIEFPDKKTSIGLIHRIYSKSYYSDDSANTNNEVIVEIIPKNSRDRKLWEHYKGVDVRVRVSRHQ